MKSNNQTSSVSDGLTESLESNLSNPALSPDVDLHAETNEVLKDIGLTTADAGGKLTFFGRDPILPSPIRFGTLAAVGLAARSVALAALWKEATGEGQDISVDVRKALRRFAGFFEGKWETLMIGRHHQAAMPSVRFLTIWSIFSSVKHATAGTWWRWTFILSSAHARSIFLVPAKATNLSPMPFPNGTQWS
jgi:hypothetical protein